MIRRAVMTATRPPSRGEIGTITSLIYAVMIGDSLSDLPPGPETSGEDRAQYEAALEMSRAASQAALSAVAAYQIKFKPGQLVELDQKFDAFAKREFSGGVRIEAALNMVIRLLEDDLPKLARRPIIRGHIEACLEHLHGMLAQYDPEFEDMETMEKGARLGLAVALEA